MRIRPEQARKMQAARDEEFCSRLCKELRAAIPEQASRFSDSDLPVLVSQAVNKARKYQICDGESLRRFVKLAVLISPEFDELPDVQRFLRMPDLDFPTKMRLLCELTAQQLRTKIS